MKCNVGKVDKAIRFGSGIAVILAGVAYGSWFGAIGVVLIATAAIGFCPAYLLFKFNTAKNDDANSCGTGGCGCSR